MRRWPVLLPYIPELEYRATKPKPAHQEIDYHLPKYGVVILPLTHWQYSPIRAYSTRRFTHTHIRTSKQDGWNAANSLNWQNTRETPTIHLVICRLALVYQLISTPDNFWYVCALKRRINSTTVRILCFDQIRSDTDDAHMPLLSRSSRIRIRKNYGEAPASAAVVCWGLGVARRTRRSEPPRHRIRDDNCDKTPTTTSITTVSRKTQTNKHTRA